MFLVKYQHCLFYLCSCFILRFSSLSSLGYNCDDGVCLGMPTPNAFDNFTLAQSNNTNKVPAAPPEDKYAALKDLDNALKQSRTEHNAVDWNSSGSNGSLYSSPTPSGSVYSSPSPQSSMFGSPSQGSYFCHLNNITNKVFRSVHERVPKSRQRILESVQ